MIKEPLPYHVSSLRKMNRLEGRCILALDMGLGKTFQVAYFTATNLDDALPLIVVCPEGVKLQWAAELRTELGLRVYVASGRKPPRSTVERRGILRDHEAIIINYEILKRWVPLLNRYKAGTLVLDEAHRVKNLKSQTFRNCEKLALKDLNEPICTPRTRYCIATTGTPMTHKPWELWSICHLIAPDLWPDSSAYAWRYCQPKRTPFGWKFDGACRKKELHRILKERVMIRKRKKDVLKDLPHKTRTIVPLPISNPKEYRLAERDIIAWLSKTSPEKAKKAKKASSLIRVGQLKKLAAELKTKALCQWVVDFMEANPTKKLAVYGIHVDFLNGLKESLAKYHPVIVNGRITGHRRERALHTFKTSKKCRLFIANIQAAGTGIDGLQKVCQSMAIVELGWTPTEHTQTEDRLWRLGQDDRVDINYLIAAGTIEEDIAAILYNRQKILDAVIDGRNLSKAEERALNDFDIFVELAKAYKAKKKRK